jgi:hypothetical protein
MHDSGCGTRSRLGAITRTRKLIRQLPDQAVQACYRPFALRVDSYIGVHVNAFLDICRKQVPYQSTLIVI